MLPSDGSSISSPGSTTVNATPPPPSPPRFLLLDISSILISDSVSTRTVRTVTVGPIHARLIYEREYVGKEEPTARHVQRPRVEWIARGEPQRGDCDTQREARCVSTHARVNTHTHTHTHFLSHSLCHSIASYSLSLSRSQLLPHSLSRWPLPPTPSFHRYPPHRLRTICPSHHSGLAYV
jgi:hypothetical protein